MLLYRAIRKLRLHELFYRTMRPFYTQKVSVTDVAVYDAERRLQALHPDGGQSCLCQNVQENPFSYDLQIVIPVYNMAQYIAECLESVLNQQTRYRFVLTVVNDGSTDDTPGILQRYAGYPNVVIINQENRGFSGARNTALAHLVGRYITFVDADDRLPSGAIEALMSAAERTQADIVEGGYSRFTGNTTTYTYQHEADEKAHWSVLYGYPVGKVYRASLFADVQFPLGYWFEDTICTYILYPRCSRVATIGDVVYEYRINEGGISFASQGDIRTLDALWVTRQVLADSQRCNIAITPALYDGFLVDLRVNYTRFVTLADETLHRDAFIVSCELMKRYFSGLRTNNPILKPLEQALFEADYGAYRLYGRCYLCV